GQRVSRARRSIINNSRRLALLSFSSIRDDLWPESCDGQPRNSCRQHYQREWYVQKVDADESRRRDQIMHAALQRPATDSRHGFNDDGFESSQHAGNRSDFAPSCINIRKREQDEDRRDNEERSGDDAAAHTMEQPTDVDRQLLRFRPRQQHAVVERVQKTLFTHPAPSLDQLAMHDPNLPRGPPKEMKPSLIQKRKASAKLTWRSTLTRSLARGSFAALAGSTMNSFFAILFLARCCLLSHQQFIQTVKERPAVLRQFAIIFEQLR